MIDDRTPSPSGDVSHATPGRRVSRLAPSPTGAQHLGNARTFLVNWALARQRGWELVLRIEDIDSPRVKPEAERDARDALSWLGLDHDGEALVQSTKLDDHWRMLERIAATGRVYRCDLTRSEIEAAAASAPHVDEHETPFLPELRPTDAPAYRLTTRDANYRLVVEPGEHAVDDGILGLHRVDPAAEVGDFLLWTKRGMPAYQLAVVVDDLRQGVTDVVRGSDLLPSAARQTLVYRALDHDPPHWWHVPLVVGPDGRRLAKRHGDSRLAHYRQLGVRAERVIGLLAESCGVEGPRREMSAAEFRDAFTLEALPRENWTFTAADEAWLTRA